MTTALATRRRSMASLRTLTSPTFLPSSTRQQPMPSRRQAVRQIAGSASNLGPRSRTPMGSTTTSRGRSLFSITGTRTQHRQPRASPMGTASPSRPLPRPPASRLRGWRSLQALRRLLGVPLGGSQRSLTPLHGGQATNTRPEGNPLRRPRHTRRWGAAGPGAVRHRRGAAYPGAIRQAGSVRIRGALHQGTPACTVTSGGMGQCTPPGHRLYPTWGCFGVRSLPAGAFPLQRHEGDLRSLRGRGKESLTSDSFLCLTFSRR